MTEPIFGYALYFQIGNGIIYGVISSELSGLDSVFVEQPVKRRHKMRARRLTTAFICIISLGICPKCFSSSAKVTSFVKERQKMQKKVTKSSLMNINISL